jgi:hypothetical protein
MSASWHLSRTGLVASGKVGMLTEDVVVEILMMGTGITL